jgi:hypothetical protein
VAASVSHGRRLCESASVRVTRFRCGRPSPSCAPCGPRAGREQRAPRPRRVARSRRFSKPPSRSLWRRGRGSRQPSLTVAVGSVGRGGGGGPGLVVVASKESSGTWRRLSQTRIPAALSSAYFSPLRALSSAWLEHLLYTQGVGGSSPSALTWKDVVPERFCGPTLSYGSGSLGRGPRMVRKWRRFGSSTSRARPPPEEREDPRGEGDTGLAGLLESD